jgi:hypothetical protein
MGNLLGFCVDSPIPATPVLCPTLYINLTTDTILDPLWPINCIGVDVRKVSLYKLITFGEEVAMIARCTFAYGEVQMWLTPVLSSLEEIWVQLRLSISDKGSWRCSIGE